MLKIIGGIWLGYPKRDAKHILKIKNTGDFAECLAGMAAFDVRSKLDKMTANILIL